MAEKKSNKAPGAPRKRRKLAGKSTGLSPAELLATSATSTVSELQKTIDDNGGKVLASYREPYGGQWLILATLPIEQVEPTPYQRNLSDTHVRKLESVIAKLERFLDPIIVVCGIKNADGVLKKPLRAALEIRQARAKAVMELDDLVVQKVEALKSKGLTSPYLKRFVVARINPIRFRPKDAAPLSFDEVLDRMTKAAAKLNVEKVKVEDLAKSGGAPEEAA